MRQTGNEVGIHRPNPRLLYSLDVAESNLAIMEPTGHRSFLIDERLHAKADTVDAALNHDREEVILQLAGSAFQGNLRIILNLKLGTNRLKEPLQQLRSKNAGCSSAEIYAVDSRRQRCRKLPSKSSGTPHLRRDAIDIPFVVFAWKNPRGEVAVGALRPAKRDRNVDSQGFHRISIFP